MESGRRNSKLNVVYIHCEALLSQIIFRLQVESLSLMCVLIFTIFRDRCSTLKLRIPTLQTLQLLLIDRYMFRRYTLSSS